MECHIVDTVDLAFFSILLEFSFHYFPSVCDYSVTRGNDGTSLDTKIYLHNLVEPQIKLWHSEPL